VAHYRKSVDTAFFDTWSPAVAYVLGFFAADGSMYVNSHGAKYVDFVSTDYIMLEQVHQLLRSEHRITLRRRRVAKPHWKPAYRLQIGGGELFNSLETLGFSPNKDETMRFPAVPLECLASFVRGYFDGDGCTSFGWYQQPRRKNLSFWVQVCFTSGSFEFLRLLDEALQANVPVAPGYLRRRSMGYYLYYQRRGDLRNLYGFLYPNDVQSQEYLPRKRVHYVQALKFLGA